MLVNKSWLFWAEQKLKVLSILLSFHVFEGGFFFFFAYVCFFVCFVSLFFVFILPIAVDKPVHLEWRSNLPLLYLKFPPQVAVAR